MITEHGKELVRKDLADAEVALAKIQKEWYARAQRVRELRKAVICDHDPVIMGSYIHIESRCSKCGYRWYD